MRPSSQLSILLAASFASLLAPAAILGSNDAESPAFGCTPAAIADIRLPWAVDVDEVRVVLSNRSPSAGAAEVTVDAGRSDRVVRVRGANSKVLSFAPALTSASFRVSLHPVLEAPYSACVERVDLLSEGSKVASIEP